MKTTSKAEEGIGTPSPITRSSDLEKLTYAGESIP